jgi:NAD(P)-dependent dehydrogenase (short-subunit alcohol dehydrogenase family)
MDLVGKTAFITGGASGIGLALARRATTSGAKVLIGDIQEEALAIAAAELRAHGADVTTYVLDVADLDQYRAVAAAVLDEHGAPDLLCNNAGVAWKGAASSATPDDWRWLVSVNILGVGFGLSLFVPAMVARGSGCILNTGSITGLITSPGTAAIYSMTKHAVVAISEALAHELRPHGLHVSVLCPGSVATQIADSDRNIPAFVSRDAFTSAEKAERDYTRAYVARGLTADDVAHKSFTALAEGRFYIVPHPEYKPEVESRHRQIEQAITGTPATDVDLLSQAKAALNLQPLT